MSYKDTEYTSLGLSRKLLLRIDAIRGTSTRQEVLDALVYYCEINKYNPIQLKRSPELEVMNAMKKGFDRIAAMITKDKKDRESLYKKNAPTISESNEPLLDEATRTISLLMDEKQNLEASIKDKMSIISEHEARKKQYNEMAKKLQDAYNKNKNDTYMIGILISKLTEICM